MVDGLTVSALQLASVAPVTVRRYVLGRSNQSGARDLTCSPTLVTNAQYERFIDANGYAEEEHWSEEGWSWRESNGITEPSYWQDSLYNGPEQPVVGVSWYEAQAFASWLSLTSGTSLRLPTEAEWEKAARGPEGLTYPWGNEFESHKLNFSGDNDGLSSSGKSSPVRYSCLPPDDEAFSYTQPPAHHVAKRPLREQIIHY